MNHNSKICQFISEHREDDWETILKQEYAVRVKQSWPYAIFNYTVGCDFLNLIVQEARGIIIDLETLEVVCWPFRKFGNFNESYADEIDWKTARVQEKVDGSIIKLWYDHLNTKWMFSTNGTIDASDAKIGENSDRTFMNIILQAENYYKIPFENLEKDYTYIFELTSPETQVVVQYPKTFLYHIGTRNNKTGEEYDLDIDIEKPKMYPLSSLEECIEAVKRLNDSQEDARVENEGFVVVDANWNRVKIKSPEYLFYHKMSTMCRMTKMQICESIINHTFDLKKMCEVFPQHARIFKFYDYQIEELFYQADVTAVKARRIYEEYHCDRKLAAEVIKTFKMANIGFVSLNNSLSGREILLRTHINRIMELIHDYKEDYFVNY